MIDTENPESSTQIELQYVKLRQSAKAPIKAHPGDVGYDISFCPDEYTSSIDAFKRLRIEPGWSVLLETGLKIKVPHGYCLEIKNRSGITSKRMLVVGACIVDPDYTGEIFVNLINIGKETQFIESGERCAQFVVYKVESPTMKEVSSVENTRRGLGFGSSGTK